METTTPAMTPPKRLPIVALLVANAISIVGNQLTALAIPWFVLLTTGSAARTGLVAAWGTAATVAASFLGGVLVDRLGLKRTSVVTDLASGPLNPLLTTVAQERIPAHLRGRVFGTILAVSWVAIPLGMLLAGTLLEVIGLRATLTALAVTYLVVTLSLFVNPALHAMDLSDTASEP